jgi:hypothetical protein
MKNLFLFTLQYNKSCKILRWTRPSNYPEFAPGSPTESRTRSTMTHLRVRAVRALEIVPCTISSETNGIGPDRIKDEDGTGHTVN